MKRDVYYFNGAFLFGGQNSNAATISLSANLTLQPKHDHDDYCIPAGMVKLLVPN